MTRRPRFVRPLGVVFGIGVAVTLAASGCSIATNTDTGSGGDAGGDGDASGGRSASGGRTSASGGAGGEGGLGGAGNLPVGTTDCDEPAACGLVECAAEVLSANHVAPCSELSPHSNPPTNGPHYTSWAQFGIYDEPIPRGFLLHGLEHGAVALLYNCSLVQRTGGSCDDLVAELESFYDEYADDPLCTAVPHRLYIVPDPLLDAPFAATAWYGHLKGGCFDADRVREFVDDHYGQSPENLCYSGIDPLAQGCD